MSNYRSCLLDTDTNELLCFCTHCGTYHKYLIKDYSFVEGGPSEPLKTT